MDLPAELALVQEFVEYPHPYTESSRPKTESAAIEGSQSWALSCASYYSI